MRVIAGKARRIPLVTVKGMETRPTTDRTKETLFNMIAHGLCDCTFLDLFSGSGAIGIEAISRGVKKAVFVENNPNAIQCIMENLKKTQLADQAEVIREDVFRHFAGWMEEKNSIMCLWIHRTTICWKKRCLLILQKQTCWKRMH